MSESINRQNRTLKQWLFNPFQFIAGGNALLLGLIVILIAAFLGSLSNTHFDGVLDVHTGLKMPAWLFFAEVLIDWLCIALFLSLSALIISKSQWRLIDVLGTQALSRWPTLITALVMLPGANRRFGEYLMSKLQGGTTIAINPTDAIIFFTAAIIALLMIIWMVALMYRAYAVSCNVKGAKAIAAFVISLGLAETASKVLIVAMLIDTLGVIAVFGGMKKYEPARPAAVIGKFENDPQLIGTWQSVDFVSEVNDFQSGAKRWTGELFLKEIAFKENGRTSQSFIWTKDWIYTDDGKTKDQYYIKLIGGEIYLFYPWLSGDVVIGGMKPQYYVLKKVSE